MPAAKRARICGDEAAKGELAKPGTRASPHVDQWWLKRQEQMSAQADACLNRYELPSDSVARLRPLVERWGCERVTQILGLWTFLGDGQSRPVSASILQAWGPPGSGKTDIVMDFVETMQIRIVRLNCACFCTAGELHAHLADGLRRAALGAARESAAAGESADAVPKQLLQEPPVGRELRALDRLEAMLRHPLEWFASSRAGGAAPGRVKVVVVLDHAQELQAFGLAELKLLMSLPQALRNGNHLAMLVVGRLPLSGMGLTDLYPAVAFPAYTKAETASILSREFTRTAVEAGRTDVVLPDDVEHLCNGVVSFALPSVGSDMRHLLPIGEDVLLQHSPLGPVCRNMPELMRKIDGLVLERVDIRDVSGFLPGQANHSADSKDADDVTVVAVDAARKRMTKMEKRLLVAVYLASRIDKKDDAQLFGANVRRRRVCRKRATDEEDDSPLTRSPEPVPVTRLLAVYHALAGQPQLLGPHLLEHLARLRHANLIRFTGDKGIVDGQVKIICRVERQLACACAGELDIDMAEYLCTS